MASKCTPERGSVIGQRTILKTRTKCETWIAIVARSNANRFLIDPCRRPHSGRLVVHWAFLVYHHVLRDPSHTVQHECRGGPSRTYPRLLLFVHRRPIFWNHRHQSCFCRCEGMTNLFKQMIRLINTHAGLSTHLWRHWKRLRYALAPSPDV
jgi:hypothetical protein